jgi:transcriptional regulator of aromatic amino acid metabolism
MKMTQKRLQKLYDNVYDYTDQLDDKALNILDDVVDRYEASHLLEAFFDETPMTEAEADLLAVAFREAAEECDETMW